MATPGRNSLRREKTWATVAPPPCVKEQAHFTHLMEAIKLQCAADSSLGGRERGRARVPNIQRWTRGGEGGNIGPVGSL